MGRNKVRSQHPPFHLLINNVDKFFFEGNTCTVFIQFCTHSLIYFFLWGDATFFLNQNIKKKKNDLKNLPISGRGEGTLTSPKPDTNVLI